MTQTPTSHRRALILWLALPVLIVAWYLMLGIGVYGFHWQGGRVQNMLRYSPLPIGFVDGTILSYRSFIEQRIGVRQSQQYLGTTTQGIYQGGTDATQVALQKMVRFAATERLAKRLGVVVSENDVAQAYQAQILQTGNADQIQAMMKQLYGWTPQQFQTYVIRPAVLRDKIQEQLSFDSSSSASAEQQAEKVLAIVKSSTDSFSELAKKYSDDAYGATGGDLGFVTQGELTKEIDDAAFSLEVNTISQVIHTKYGFHIIKPVERKTVDGTDQVHVLQITILAPQVDAAIDTEVKQEHIGIFDNGYRWSKEKNSVVAK